jgi:hypothetical protein
VDWSPRTSEAVALAVIGLGLALAVLLLDSAGRILVGAAAVLLLALAARDLALRPRLSAGPAGLVVRGLTGRRELSWAGLRIGVRTTRRWGIPGRTLELDTAQGPDDDGVLVVLGRRDLGADPAAVARALHELDPRSGAPPS